LNTEKMWNKYGIFHIISLFDLLLLRIFYIYFTIQLSFLLHFP
jgi:hypothetical protein